jgi:phospholipid transport system substrate-binding protein
MKKIKILFLFISCFVFSSLINAQTSPLPMLESSANKIINSLQANKSALKNNKDIIYRSVRQNLLPIVDVQGMSRSVLGRQAWNKATPSERKAFSKEFTRLVIRTYASPLAEYNGEKIKFHPIRSDVNKRFVRVSSVIVRNDGPNIPLNYSLVSKNGQWKIYDISVEGVSLLQSFRSQFAQSLQNSNISALISEMREHSKKTG